MITDADIKKLKEVFATREGMEKGFIEIIEFIGEVKNDITKELNEFRNEMRDINRGNQSILNNHESRIAHLEYTNKIT